MSQRSFCPEGGLLPNVKDGQVNSLRDLQLLELELFKKFKALCELHSLTYFAMGGTLLGAVRHKGFIPWDDDMDIGMPREDYDRFLELCAHNETDMTVSTFVEYPNHTRYFARIEDPSLSVMRYDMNPPEETPAWIDLFPLDGMPDTPVRLLMHKSSIQLHRALFRLSLFNETRPSTLSNRPWYEVVLIRMQRLVPMYRVLNPRRSWRSLDRCLRRYPYASSPSMINAMGHWKFREMFPKSVYGEGREYSFEGCGMNGPIDFDTVCTQLYGDYMTPVNDSHHQPVYPGQRISNPLSRWRNGRRFKRRHLK